MTPADLRLLRAGLRLTQQQLADRLGINRHTVKKWESGRHPVSRMAEILLRRLTR